MIFQERYLARVFSQSRSGLILASVADLGEKRGGPPLPSVGRRAANFLGPHLKVEVNMKFNEILRGLKRG